MDAFLSSVGIPARVRSGLAQLLGSSGLLVGAEMANRVTRIATAVVLARVFSIEEFGIAAAALTAHELTRMLIQNGLGTRVVAASDAEVRSIANAVHYLNWQLGIVLFAIQALVAWPIGSYFGSSYLTLAIIGLATVHIIYPFAMVQVYLAQRADRWRFVSAAMAVTACLDNVLTAAMAAAGWGLLAIVIPKLIVAAGWVIAHRRWTNWRATGVPDRAEQRRLIYFSVRVLVVEVLSSLRNHGDKALVGLILGPVALGMYAFAANIGRSITSSLAGALSYVVLPRLRRARENGDLLSTHCQTLVIMFLTTLPFAAVISGGAGWFVPVVFGDKWNHAVPLLSVMALLTMAHPLLVATSQMLRATDRAGADLAIGLAATAGFFIGLAWGLQYDLFMGALLSGLGQAIAAIAAAAWSVMLLRKEQGSGYDCGSKLEKEALS